MRQFHFVVFELAPKFQVILRRLVRKKHVAIKRKHFLKKYVSYRLKNVQVFFVRFGGSAARAALKSTTSLSAIIMAAVQKHKILPYFSRNKPKKPAKWRD